MKNKKVIMMLTMLSLMGVITKANAFENTPSPEQNIQNINIKNQSDTNEKTTNTPETTVNSEDATNNLNENDKNNIKALTKNNEEINSIIETAKNEINRALNQMNNLELEEIKNTKKRIISINKRLEEVRTTNEQTRELYWKTKDLMNLLEAHIVIKAAEKDIKNTQELIKEIKSKNEVTDKFDKEIKKINERFEIAKNNIPTYINEYKDHVKKEGKKFIFFTEEFKPLIENLENLNTQLKNVNENLNTLQTKIKNEKTTNTPETTVNSEDAPNNLNKNNSNNIKTIPENSEEINSIIETAKNEINRALNQMNNLKLEELTNTEKRIISINKRLEKVRTTNEQTRELYWKTKDLMNLLEAHIVIKAAEKDIKNTQDLVKEIKSKNEVTDKFYKEIKKINERFEIAKNNIPTYINEYKDHVKKEGKKFIFFTEEFKPLIENLENLNTQLKNVNENLNTLQTKIKTDNKAIREAAEKLNKFNDIMQSKKWDKLNINELRKTINNLKEAIETMNKIKDPNLKLKAYDNQKAREIYFKLLDFKNVLIAKKDYLKALETHNKIENLKENINYKIDKNNIKQEDINEIKETQKELKKTKEMIAKRIKVCEKHISKKDENIKHLYFLDETQYLLSYLYNIDKTLEELAPEINKIQTDIILKLKVYIENETKKLKKEYDDIRDAYYVDADDEDEEDEIEKNYQTNIKEFKRKQEKFENKYDKAYNILKDINPESAEEIKKIYNDFMKHTSLARELD